MRSRKAWAQGLCGFAFLGFLGFQLLITLCPSIEAYPFSPYRMFSKNWRDGIVMERIRYQVPGESNLRFSWELLGIPFFQANSLSYRVFLDRNDPQERAAFCRAFGRTHPRVVHENVRYQLHGGRMTETITLEETVHECI